jgi:hypothetical protein
MLPAQGMAFLKRVLDSNFAFIFGSDTSNEPTENLLSLQYRDGVATTSSMLHNHMSTRTQSFGWIAESKSRIRFYSTSEIVAYSWRALDAIL